MGGPGARAAYKQTLYLRTLVINPPLLNSLPPSLIDLALPCAYLRSGGLSRALQRLPGLTSLCLAGCISLTQSDLLSVPLSRMTGLKVLRLDDCALRELPKQLPGLTSLQVLNLRNNKLEHLRGEGTAFLRRLQALDVSNNSLQIGAPALLQQAPALQLLVWTDVQHYMARSVSPTGTRLEPAVAASFDLSGYGGEYYFGELVRAPQLIPLWRLLRGEPEYF
ncbi:hypothetical protein N2152v2_006413 [Parachlorella kessleri]